MTMGAPSEKKCAQRNRIKYSPAQLERLETEFARSHYPDTVTMEDLAGTLDVSMDRVSIWFQNRRSKFKRQSKDSQVTWMRKQIYQNTSSPTNVIQPKVISQRHVLSAPAYPVDRRDMSWYRASSNIHYLPSVPVMLDQLADVHQSPPPSTCPSPPESEVYAYSPLHVPEAHSPPMPVSPPLSSPLSPRSRMLTHLMSEAHHTTGSYPAYANQAPPSCVFADHYNVMYPTYQPFVPFSQMTGV